jgi:hypothetical protein
VIFDWNYQLLRYTKETRLRKIQCEASFLWYIDTLSICKEKLAGQDCKIFAQKNDYNYDSMIAHIFLRQLLFPKINEKYFHNALTD